jgi:predicted secreted protein with PEFG-CTERM motif
MTSPLSAAATETDPVNVEVTFKGYGAPGSEMTGPVGQVATKQVVPEFGTIAMMILTVSIISIVAITAKSKVIPRF